MCLLCITRRYLNLWPSQPPLAPPPPRSWVGTRDPGSLANRPYASSLPEPRNYGQQLPVMFPASVWELERSGLKQRSHSACSGRWVSIVGAPRPAQGVSPPSLCGPWDHGGPWAASPSSWGWDQSAVQAPVGGGHAAPLVPGTQRPCPHTGCTLPARHPGWGCLLPVRGPGLSQSYECRSPSGGSWGADPSAASRRAPGQRRGCGRPG